LYQNFDQSEADVVCTWCGTNLPDDSQFCLKCGNKAHAAANSAPPATIPSQSACGHCGKGLPPAAAFCPQCGRPVMSAANSVALAIAEAKSLALRARRKRRILLWLFVLALFGVALWAATSQSPEAEEVQEFVHLSQAQTIVDAPVPVNPRSFSSREFTVPPGALDVSVTGEFTASANSPRRSNGRDNGGGKDHDNGVEVYVLTNSAFVIWSSGYSTATLYQSGLTDEGVINAPLPAGAGVYYLVFSNRVSPRAKMVQATGVLRYKSGWPNAVTRLKERLWNWLDL
jgi:RNA polymerase subunit RPABC4/transcription elongation factor Spt4